MKRVATCVIALLSAYNGALAADEAVFVEKGNARSVREMGNRWIFKEGSLVCGGTGNFLVAGKAVGAGDFQVRARLSLERLDGTAASLMIGGNHFGFGGVTFDPTSPPRPQFQERLDKLPILPSTTSLTTFAQWLPPVDDKHQLRRDLPFLDVNLI